MFLYFGRDKFSYYVLQSFSLILIFLLYIIMLLFHYRGGYITCLFVF